MPSSAIELVSPKVELNGSLLTDAVMEWLVEVRVDLELRLPSRVELRFDDPHGDLAGSDRFALGGGVKVKLANGAVLIDAEITGFRYEAVTGARPSGLLDGRRGQLSQYVVTGYDRSHRLTHATSIKGYNQMTASDIVTQLASDVGLTANVTATSTVYPYVGVAHSRFELLNALADREGCDWWVDENKSLQFKPPATTTTITLDLTEPELESFTVQATGVHPTSVAVRGWDPKNAQGIQGNQDLANSSLWPDTDFVNGFKTGGTFGSGTLVTSVPQVFDDSDAGVVAGAIRDRLVSGSVIARGVAHGNAGIKIGHSVQIKGSKPVNGVYHVTKVEHLFRRDEFRTRFVAGDRAPRSMVDTLGPQGNAATVPLQQPGLLIGVVTSVGDGGDNNGLIQVKFPGIDDKFVSTWARFVSPGAGQEEGRGLVALPEVNDQVLVGFENGDLHRPVVIGALYQMGSHVTPWPVEGGKVTSRRFTSRAGHVLEFNDGDSDAKKFAKLTVKSEAGQVVLNLAGDKVELTAEGGQPITVTTGQSKLEMKKDGSITLSGGKVQINGTQQVDIKAPTVNVTADNQLSLSGQMKAELKSSMETEVSAALSVAVKGAEVKLN